MNNGELDKQLAIEQAYKIMSAHNMFHTTHEYHGKDAMAFLNRVIGKVKDENGDRKLYTDRRVGKNGKRESRIIDLTESNDDEAFFRIAMQQKKSSDSHLRSSDRAKKRYQQIIGQLGLVEVVGENGELRAM